MDRQIPLKVGQTVFKKLFHTSPFPAHRFAVKNKTSISYNYPPPSNELKHILPQKNHKVKQLFVAIKNPPRALAEWILFT
jgi:hypothetical protein